MIHLITGKPGHGKNIYALTFLEKEKIIHFDKETDKFSSTIDRPLYFIEFADVNILNSQSLPYEALNSLPVKIGEPVGDTFEDGAVIVIDEAHLFSPKSSNKDGFSPFVSFLKIHRHFGFDFIFITQSQKDLNIDIRNLVENHFRVIRPFGVSTCSVNKYLGCETKDNPNPISQSIKKFSLDKRFFTVYKSASIHNYKSSIPKKYYVYLVFILVFVYFVASKGFEFYNSFENGGVFNFDNKGKQQRGGSGLPLPVVTPTSDSHTFFYYKFKHPTFFKSSLPSLVNFAKDRFFLSTGSAYCHCTKPEISFLKKVFAAIDTTSEIKVDFFVVSMEESDFNEFNLNYSFGSNHFRVNNGLENKSIFLFDFMVNDFKSLLFSKSSSLLSVGYSFDSKFITSYPKLLNSVEKETDTSGLLGNNNSNNRNSEEISLTDVGFNFEIDTSRLPNNRVSFKLSQSHSFVEDAFIDELPVVSKREFNTNFALSEGDIVPLFALNSILKSTTKNNLFSFLVPNTDSKDRKYQFFMSFTKVDAKPADNLNNLKDLKRSLKTINDSD